MHYGMIEGSVVCTQKVSEMKGVALKVLVPCTKEREPVGERVVAVDPIGARPGDLVLWVGKREASLAIPDSELRNLYPVDVAVTGIVDDIG